MGPGGHVFEAPSVRSAANPVPCGARACGCAEETLGDIEMVRASEGVARLEVVEMIAPLAEAPVEPLEVPAEPFT